MSGPQLASFFAPNNPENAAFELIYDVIEHCPPAMEDGIGKRRSCQEGILAMPPSASLKRSASGDGASSASGDAKRIKTERRVGAGDDGPIDTKAFTHVYLCIDRSGSMNNRDVAIEIGGDAQHQFMSRYDAVFAAAAHLVQLQRGKGIDFSLILWNDEAEWIFRNRDADETLALLTEAKISNPPRLGTNFSSCFKKLRGCIVGGDNASGGGGNGTGKGKVKTEMNAGTSGRSSSVLIFLSDGRPGDLRANPPNAGEQIQPTYRRNKQDHESVGGHLGALVPYLSPGTLHFVGIHESGYPWLRCLAERYNGTFHQSTLHFGQVDNNGDGGGDGPGVGENLAGGEEVPASAAASAVVDDAINDDENELGNQPAAAAAAAAANMANENISIGGENGNTRGNEEEEEKKEEEDADDKNDDDDDDLEFVEEVSANERIRRNIANGEVINIASQSQPQSQSQSIMDTFSSLSQSLSQFHESQYDDSQSDDGSYCDQEDPYADDL